MTGQIKRSAHKFREDIIRLRRTFHRNPELSLLEEQTAVLIRQELDALGIPWESVETGTVATLSGKKHAPTIVLRADIDALPVTEETGLPFASEVPGVMHACGHDGHMAIDRKRSHHEKPPEVTCTSRGTPGCPASTRERPRETFFNTSRGQIPLL